MRDFIIKDDVLEQCAENDSNVVIPEGVTLIEKYAFENCRSLTEIKIPAHTVVENDAFTGCLLLEDERL
jgi:hypothetical protein